MKEKKIEDVSVGRRDAFTGLKSALKDKQFWLLGFFLFFWTFSPSFGTPFFYYSVDTLKFDRAFFGLVASVGAAASAIGALSYGFIARRFSTRKLLNWIIGIGVFGTIFQLIFFLASVKGDLSFARTLFVSASAVFGIVNGITFLTMMNAAALSCPKWSEGTVFATLTACWNIGLLSSDAIGGFLFGKIGLVPLIWVSTIFTALTWFILPKLRFGDDQKV